MNKNKHGFTIVELLIVIVVIAILAVITIVGYTTIQQRARDSQRDHDAVTIAKALEIFRTDRGGYPICGTTNAYQAGGSPAGTNAVTCLTSALVPEYISKLPTDPKNTGSFQYFYANGSRKVTAASYTTDRSDNYIFAYKRENSYATQFSAFGRTDLNVLTGSNN